MRGDGRLIHAGGSAFLCLLLLHATIQNAATNEYGVPIEIKMWDTGRTPLAHMVDVTNGFGLKVLAEHNFLNENNIAFSPYGLLGILVALYEGIDGESSYQLQKAMQLPWNRNVMRVGFRDIHRTLKTYFVPEEGFLAGLALNNENVTFNDSYKKILRFYGFDLDNNEQIPTLAPNNNATNNDTATTTVASTTGMPAADSAATTMPEATTMPATTREETTPSPNPSAETLNDNDIRGPTTETSQSSAPTAESTTTTSTRAPSERSTAEAAPLTTETPQTTQAPQTTDAPQTVTEQPTTTVAPTAEETTPTAERIDTESIPVQMSSTMTVTDEPTVNNEIDTTSDISSSSGSTAEMTTVSSSNVETTQTMENTSPALSELTTTLSEESSTAASTLETFQKRKRSIVDYLYYNPPFYQPFENDYLFHRSYDIPIPSVPDTLNTNFEANQMFLVNGLRRVQVTYMHYDTILEYAYLPHLEASALRLPLDSDRYYLLVILPTRGGTAELGRLLARMARGSDLSDVCSALIARRVKAIVPSFTVKGHISLTTDLQKLGIRDVFEPRQHDFTPMTHQTGVYVRSIEQSVSVAIRKYRSTDSNPSGRFVATQHPVTFSATYPFLYFVMDGTIHVSLMAGKMVDPLNSRIL